MRTATRLWSVGSLWRRPLLAALWLGAASQAATLLRLPYLQNVQADHATIMWTTRENGSGAVEYSSDNSYSQRAAAQVREFLPAETGLSEAFYQFQAELKGLRPATEYRYRILVDAQNLTPSPGLGDGLHLRTDGPGPFTFLALGDSGAGTPEQAQIARLMAAENPALVLHTGDVAYWSGTFEEFQAHYFDCYAALMQRAPFFPTPGNHDYVTGYAAPYLAVHSVPRAGVAAQDAGRYYSFDWANVHFVSLDSHLLPSSSAGGMLAWLERDLLASRKFWKVVYFHHAPYVSGFPADDAVSALARERVVPILERNGVQLVLGGHEHACERTLALENGAPVAAGSGAVYIITGGGGAGLQPVRLLPISAFAQSVHNYLHVDVQGPQMTVRAVGLDGQELDRVTLTALPRIQSQLVVNAATFTNALAPGSLITILGQNLAVEERQAPGFPLPAELSGTTVEFNGQPIPLLYVSAGKINAQLPYGLPGRAALRVRTPDGAADASISMAQSAPAILSISGDPGAAPAIVHSGSGALVSDASPAIPGEFLTVYAIGLGPVIGEIAAGQAAPASPPLSVQAEVEVRLGNVQIQPAFAGLSPGLAGLYQVNLVVPAGAPAGPSALRILVAGISSNTVTLPIGSSPASGKRRSRSPPGGTFP